MIDSINKANEFLWRVLPSPTSKALFKVEFSLFRLRELFFDEDLST